MSENSISFGRNAKFGKVQIQTQSNSKEILSGLKINDDSIFKKYDKNGDKILTDNELQEIKNFLLNADKNNNGTITRNEARKWLKQQGLLNDTNAKEWLTAINQLFEEGDVKETERDTDGNQTVTRNDDTTETYDKNGNLTKKVDGNTTTEYKNVDGKQIKTKETVKDGDKTTVTEFDDNGRKTKETVTENDTTTTIEYTDGKKSKEIINKDGELTTIEYNTEEKQESKTVKKGAVTTYYDANNRKLKEVTDKGNGVTETTEYQYDDNGNLTGSIKTDAQGNQIKYDANGKEIKTPAKAFTDVFENGECEVTVDGKATGLTKEETYQGKIRLAKGENLESGKFPQNLRMTLPKGYDGTMQLNLIDEENGIYETNAHDRQF